MGKNPIKIIGLINLFLLVGLIVFLVVVKQKQKDGKIGYFFKDEDEEPKPLERMGYSTLDNGVVGPIDKRPSPANPEILIRKNTL